MKYAIIAAGQGSRLSSEGVSLPKPLVKVGNECLIDRLLRIFVANHADEIIVICNEEMTNVQTHLQAIQQKGLKGEPITLKIVIRSTPSSMHSLAEMRPLLENAPFCLTTVDAIFEEDTFMTYVQEFKKALQQGVDAYMGVTKFVDDEKPMSQCVYWAFMMRVVFVTNMSQLAFTDCIRISSTSYSVAFSVANNACVIFNEHSLPSNVL